MKLAADVSAACIYRQRPWLALFFLFSFSLQIWQLVFVEEIFYEYMFIVNCLQATVGRIKYELTIGLVDSGYMCIN